MADVNIDPETFEFHEQIKAFLSLIVDTDYDKKECFLGSLIGISNEALDKIRVESFTDESKRVAQPELYIRIVPDKTNNTLSIIDSGIGMTKADLMNSFGTSSMVRRFGVNFYLGLLVAQKVIATTKHNDDEQYVWESQADDDSFTVTRDVNGEQIGRGNKITLFLKEDQLEYLEETRIKELVKKHTEFISYPIYLWTEIDKVKEEERVLIGKIDEDKEKESKDIKEVSGEWELINRKPIWLRKPEETTKDEYASFYKSLAYNAEDYLAVKQFCVEGQIQFNAILFVPNRVPLLKSKKKNSNIKLYVRRIFIMDNCEEFLPEYLRFVSGVVDSNDLPLNVSRDEMLQQNMDILQLIKESLMQKCFEMFYDIVEKEQGDTQFYQAFSTRLELGIHEDNQNRAKLADVLQYHATKKSFKNLCKMIKDILGDKVEKVVVSYGSLDSPCVLVTCGEEFKDHPGKKTMEINPHNDIIEELREIVEAGKHNESMQELVRLLFETALLSSGFGIDEPKLFASRIHKMLELVVMSYKDSDTDSDFEDSDYEDSDNSEYLC